MTTFKDNQDEIKKWIDEVEAKLEDLEIKIDAVGVQ